MIVHNKCIAIDAILIMAEEEEEKIKDEEMHLAK